MRCPDAELLRAAFHIVILCQHGIATQVVDFREVHHHSGSVLWIPPGTVHERTPAIQGMAVCFTSAFLGFEQMGAAERAGATIPEGTMGGAWNLQGSDLDDVEAMIRVLNSEYTRLVNGPTGLGRIRGDAMLRHLLIALVQRIHSVPRERDVFETTHPVARRFVEMAELNFCRRHTVAAYAAALGYSARTLQRVCYEEIGVTPRQYIDNCIAEEAERLLTLTELSIAAVGRSVGFNDAANFSKFFQRQTGQTPGAFRRSLCCRND